MASTPRLSTEERANALRKATAVRMARRAFKDAVEHGDFTLAGAIAHARGDAALAGIRVHDLLRCFPRVGPKRASALMEEAHVAPSRRVRGLGEHQAGALARRMDA